MSALKVNKQQLGIHSGAFYDFVFDASAADGTMKLRRGTLDNIGGDIFTVSTTNEVVFAENPAYMCACAVFDGQVAGPVSPLFGFGVYTVTRTATGTYELLLSLARDDANFVVQTTAYNGFSGLIGTVISTTVDTITLGFYDAGGVLQNPGKVNVTIWKV